MNFIKIKFFPSDKIDYLCYYFFNFFIAILFILNIQNFNNLFSFGKTSTYILLIPITDNFFEENKDSIFSRLSTNNQILSVKKIDNKIILEELSRKIDLDLIPDVIVPEVFEIAVKKKFILT